MESLHDQLIFDNRNTNDLFGSDHSSQIYYADVLGRWTNGNNLSNIEKRIIENILILNPKYILENGRSLEFIEIIRNSLQRQELVNPENPEIGLFFYTLFYLLLKTGAAKEALKLLPELDNIFTQYKKSGISILNVPNTLNSSRFQFKMEKTPDPIQLSYFEIISLVLDSNELLFLEPDFNLNRLPIPDIQISEGDCSELRYIASDFYLDQDYEKATAIYKTLRFKRFDLPGTLTHMARVELSNGNVQQVEFFTEMAWRHRRDASLYVLARILWFKLYLCILETINQENYHVILGQLKTVLHYRKSIMVWSMEPALNSIQSKISTYQCSLLASIVEAFSYGTANGRLNEYQEWRDAKPTNWLNQFQLNLNEEENTLNNDNLEVLYKF